MRSITTHKGSVWGGNYVYAVLKRYKERLEREGLENRNMNQSFLKCGLNRFDK